MVTLLLSHRSQAVEAWEHVFGYRASSLAELRDEDIINVYIPIKSLQTEWLIHDTLNPEHLVGDPTQAQVIRTPATFPDGGFHPGLLLSENLKGLLQLRHNSDPTQTTNWLNQNTNMAFLNVLNISLAARSVHTTNNQQALMGTNKISATLNPIVAASTVAMSGHGIVGRARVPKNQVEIDISEFSMTMENIADPITWVESVRNYTDFGIVADGCVLLENAVYISEFLSPMSAAVKQNPDMLAGQMETLLPNNRGGFAADQPNSGSQAHVTQLFNEHPKRIVAAPCEGDINPDQLFGLSWRTLLGMVQDDNDD